MANGRYSLHDTISHHGYMLAFLVLKTDFPVVEYEWPIIAEDIRGVSEETLRLAK